MSGHRADGSVNVNWQVYQGSGQARNEQFATLPKPPPWRRFAGEPLCDRPEGDGGETERRIGGMLGVERIPDRREVAMVNAAIYLRRPLLVTGRPGTGKSSLAYVISRELGLGPVLRWSITSRSILKDGLYLYDAIGRVQEAGARTEQDREPDIGKFVHLGPLGTALLPYEQPRVLLIDELDKSDIDLPNDLLNVFEDGEYEIPELTRLARLQPDVTVMTHDRDGAAMIRRGRVQCRAFPIVIITSNGEREFPAPFLRRCLKLNMSPPDAKQLGAMIAAQFGSADWVDTSKLIQDFLERSKDVGGLASDQLLNAVHLAAELATSGEYHPGEDWYELLTAIWHPLTSREPG
jgi:MoxR-like ATPase